MSEEEVNPLGRERLRQCYTENCPGEVEYKDGLWNCDTCGYEGEFVVIWQECWPGSNCFHDIFIQKGHISEDAEREEGASIKDVVVEEEE